jgi:hypothetical protein
MLAAGETMSMVTSSNSNSNNHEDLTIPHNDDLIEIVSIPHDGSPMNHYSRSLKDKNVNCDFSGKISCKVLDGNNTDCADMNIRRDKCSEVTILLTFTYCNDETDPDNRIVIIPSLTYGDLYKSNRFQLNTDPLRHGKCRNFLKTGKVDTCTRNRVNAEMKIEGWKKFRRNYGSYCHIYEHYFPKINKYDPPVAPEYEVTVKCFLENGKGTEDFSIPCDDLGPDYFEKRRLRALQVGLEGVTVVETEVDYSRNVKYEFIIRSNAVETVRVDEISVLLDEVKTIIADTSDNIIVLPDQTITVASYETLVDFGTYSGDKFELGSSVIVTGLKSGQSTTEMSTETISVP